MQTVPAPRQHFPALDGLRGLAILLVVVYHNFGFIPYFFFGWLGVDLFFVLSGFLITDILMKSLGQPGYLKNFYIRRVLRIFPLYYLSLILFLFLIPLFTDRLDIGYYRENQAWLWLYLQNWLYIFNDPASHNTLNHFWSLAVEEQFYLLWPWIILLLKKPGRLLLLLGLLLLAVIGLRLWIWNHQVADLAYFNLYTFTRIDGICVGSMVALLRISRPAFLDNQMPYIVGGFALLNFVFYFINRQYQYSYPYLALAGYSTFAMVFGLLVHEAVSGENKLISRLFSWSPLRFFGRISYGFYIFHWPVHLLVVPAITPLLSAAVSGRTLSLVAALVSTLIAVLVSWLSLRYIESYFLRLKKGFGG